IRDEAKARGCDVVGEEYLLLGSDEAAGIVKRIVRSRPDLIVNTINGDSNVAFFRELRRAGVTSRDTPPASFSLSEEGLSARAAPRAIPWPPTPSGASTPRPTRRS